MADSSRLVRKGIALAAGLVVWLPVGAASRSTHHSAHAATSHHAPSYKSADHEQASRKPAKGHESHQYAGHTHKKHWKLSQSAPSADRVGEIQTALSKQGFYEGETSGRWDDSTMGAVRHFQQQNGLDPTGRLDALTLQKLGLGSDVAGMSAPKPPGD
jgi:hypothetical protein